ncbi:MAG: PEGA domain-containing protein [Acidobacteriota bacterium]|nr:PEGA domain-containing protein [Acidobacteriota bacterium]
MKRVLAVFLLLLLAVPAFAKDQPIIMTWPSVEKPFVRFTFGKFNKIGSLGNQNSYSVEVVAENLWGKPIPEASFDVYFFSKDNIRIGSGHIYLTQVGVKETVRFVMPFGGAGAQPATLKLSPDRLPKELSPAEPARKVRLTVYSIPAGAKLALDGVDQGETPKQVEMANGKHVLTFAMEGYKTGNYPVEIGPNDVSGGTVSYELGGVAHDTIELRDGTTLNGDLEVVDATSVQVRIGGRIQTFERNQVKRIMMVEREAPPALPAAK